MGGKTRESDEKTDNINYFIKQIQSFRMLLIGDAAEKSGCLLQVTGISMDQHS